MYIINRNIVEESKRVSRFNRTRSPLIKRNTKVRASRRSQKNDTSSSLKTAQDKNASINKVTRMQGLGKRQKLAIDERSTCVQYENDSDSLWTNRSMTLFQPSLDSTDDSQKQNLWTNPCTIETTKFVRFEEDMGPMDKMKKGISKTAILLGEQVDKVVNYGIEKKAEYDARGETKKSSS
jgi:hypothetical protein